MERWCTGEHLVTHTAETVDIASTVDGLFAGGLLRAHIGRRAERDARRGERVAMTVLDGLAGDAKVGEQRLTVDEQHVLRLEVAVHHAAAMRVVESISNLSQNARALVERERAIALEAVPQRLTLDERHDEVQESVCLAGVVQRQNVWMLKACDDSDLAEKAFGAERRRQVRKQHLDGDAPLVLAVAGEVDAGHPPSPDLAYEVVAVHQGLGERPFELRSHARTGNWSHSIASRRATGQTMNR
jgi:hypothetical protein